MKNHFNLAYHSTQNHQKFVAGIQKLINQIPPQGIFTGDNLFAYGRNLSFLDDEPFMAAFNTHANGILEESTIWRLHVLCWAAKRALAFEGDFVECGTYKGTSARIIADYVDFASLDRRFYLYDLFEHSDDMDHHDMPAHGKDLFGQVKKRFADLKNFTVIQGEVPKSFAQAVPEKIAFLHIDMNNADAEIGALDEMFDKVTPGAGIILDDYGWLRYREQKEAEDRFFADRGLQVLELPTGQGLVIK